MSIFKVKKLSPVVTNFPTKSHIHHIKLQNMKNGKMKKEKWYR